MSRVYPYLQLALPALLLSLPFNALAHLGIAHLGLQACWIAQLSLVDLLPVRVRQRASHSLGVRQALVRLGRCRLVFAIRIRNCWSRIRRRIRLLVLWRWWIVILGLERDVVA